MAQILIVGDSCQFVLDYLLYLFLNAVIVGVYHIPHTILAILVRKVGNDRYRLVSLRFDTVSKSVSELSIKKGPAMFG